jgi:hypothetical protein
VSSFRKLVLHDAAAFNISGVEDGRIVNDGHFDGEIQQNCG